MWCPPCLDSGLANPESKRSRRGASVIGVHECNIVKSLVSIERLTAERRRGWRNGRLGNRDLALSVAVLEGDDRLAGLDEKADGEFQRPYLVRHSVRALGENLVGVLGRCQHRSPYIHQEIVGYVLVEEVTHAVDGHQPRRFPVTGLMQPFRMEGDVKAIGEPRREPMGDGLGVAMITPRADLPASGVDRVP